MMAPLLMRMIINWNFINDDDIDDVDDDDTDKMD